MKKILLLLSMVMIVFITNAQKRTSTVNISDLSPELQAQIQKEQENIVITKELEQYGEWAGMGKEIGVAVKEGLSALTSEVEKVSKTDVGKLTMFIIAYKVIGDDAKAIIFGPFLMLFLTIVYLYLRRKWYGIKKIKVVDAVKEGPFWNRKLISKAEYEIFNPNDNDDESYVVGKAISVGVYAIFMLIIILSIL